jgi:hypothetical protein
MSRPHAVDRLDTVPLHPLGGGVEPPLDPGLPVFMPPFEAGS